MEIYLAPILATTEELVPLANNPIMLGTLIQLFSHLEHQIHLQMAEIIWVPGHMGVGNMGTGHMGAGHMGTWKYG